MARQLLVLEEVLAMMQVVGIPAAHIATFQQQAELVLGKKPRKELDEISPDQLQWVLDHNMQIRAGHRVQIAKAVQAWRAVEARVQELEREVARLKGER